MLTRRRIAIALLVVIALVAAWHFSPAAKAPADPDQTVATAATPPAVTPTATPTPAPVPTPVAAPTLETRVTALETDVKTLKDTVATKDYLKGEEFKGVLTAALKPAASEDDLKKAQAVIAAKDAEIAALKPRTIEGIKENSGAFCQALEDLDDVLATSEDRLNKLLDKRRKRLEGKDRVDDHPAAPGLSRGPGN